MISTQLHFISEKCSELKYCRCCAADIQNQLMEMLKYESNANKAKEQ